MKRIIIGTRGSQLARIQTTIVKNLIEKRFPEIKIEVKVITTSGDKNMKPIPLDTVGKGWFTKEIDKQLLEGKIDLAVHSLKDVLDAMHPELSITAVPEREDAREALVTRNNIILEKLKKDTVIGTDSIRRKMQLLKMRNDIVVKSIRGNVNTRLMKLDNGEYDGLLLAVAGLKRLGLQNRISQYFATKNFIPSPGQGALAIVTKKSNKVLIKMLSQLTDEEALLTTTVEREFSKLTDGGCSLPVGGYAKIKGEKITLYGMIGSEDEKHIVKGFIIGNKTDAQKLTQKLAEKLLRAQKYVILTRTKEENKILTEKMAAMNIRSISCPGITINKNLSGDETKKFLVNLTSYDWIIFTSGNGVKFFMQSLGEQHSTLPKNIQIAVVGDKTAAVVQKYGLKISFVPKTFTAEQLVKELPDCKGKKILLPRSNIGKEDVTALLEKRGAIVTDMLIYKTTTNKTTPANVLELIHRDQIRCLMFASPSAIEGFTTMFNKNLTKILSFPVLSIGPVTTKAARKYGFKNITTATIHTTEGMIRKLEKNIL
jgi:hydroxymethylbilane synthase